MKRAFTMRKKGLLILISLVTMAAVLVPGVLAAPGAGVWYSDGTWAAACGSGSDGALKFMIEANVPPDHTVVVTWVSETSSHGRHDYYNKWIETTGLYSVSPQYWVVPYDGWIKLTHKVYAPDTKLLTQAYAYANCLTGEIQVNTTDVY